MDFDRKKRKSEEADNLEEKLLKALKNANGAAKLAALVLNRGSFPHTVDNLFSLSMLVRQGRAEVTMSEDHDHLVALREGETPVDAKFIYNFDFHDWELMKTQVRSGEELMEQQPQNEDTPLKWAYKGIRKKARKKDTGIPQQVECQLNTTSSLDGLGLGYETDEETISEDLAETLIDISGFDLLDEAESVLKVEQLRSPSVPTGSSGLEQMESQTDSKPENESGKHAGVDLGLQLSDKNEGFSESPRSGLLTYSRRRRKQAPEVPEMTLEMIKHYTRQALSKEASLLVIQVPKKKRTINHARSRVDAASLKKNVEEQLHGSTPEVPQISSSSKTSDEDATIMLKRFKRFRTPMKRPPRKALIAQVKARLKALFKAKC